MQKWRFHCFVYNFVGREVRVLKFEGWWYIVVTNLISCFPSTQYSIFYSRVVTQEIKITKLKKKYSFINIKKNDCQIQETLCRQINKLHWFWSWPSTPYCREFLKNIGPIKSQVKTKSAHETAQEVMSTSSPTPSVEEEGADSETEGKLTAHYSQTTKLPSYSIKKMLELLCDEAVRRLIYILPTEGRRGRPGWGYHRSPMVLVKGIVFIGINVNYI